MITREQVADLREGDFVRVTGWYGLTVEGRVSPRESDGTLWLGPYVRFSHEVGEMPTWTQSDEATLTVVSRAPRPLYVNHPRAEPVPGDVFVQDDGQSFPLYIVEESGRVARHRRNGTVSWLDAGDARLPARLRLLVDGETGQVVPS